MADNDLEEYDYILIPIEVSPEVAKKINEKFQAEDKKNADNILLHQWGNAEIFGKEKLWSKT